MRALIERLLEKDPDARPQDPQEVAEAFGKLADQGSATSLQLEVPPGSLASVWNPDHPAPLTGTTIPPPRRRSRAPLAAVGILLVVGLLAGLRLPWVRLQLASPEEASRYQAVVEARDSLPEADDATALMSAIENYLRDFGKTGWLREDVRSLRTEPLPLRANLYLIAADDAEMAFVPGGSYAIGDPEGAVATDLAPERTVHLQSFLIDRNEVSNERYERFLAEWRAAGSKHLCGRTDLDHDPFKGHRVSLAPDAPVVGLSPYDALEYARFYGRRLPTEDEWEVAASYDPQNAKASIYPWGTREPGEDNPYFANLKFAEYGEMTPDGEFNPLCAPSGTFEFDRSGFGLSPASSPSAAGASTPTPPAARA
jgi:hypothetical protein